MFELFQVTGPDYALPVLAKAMKAFILDVYKINNIKIHLAVTLNEDISLRLLNDGLHAVIICTDASLALSRPSAEEALKHLGFDLLSGSIFIINLIKPRPAVFPTVADTIEKLSITYNIALFNILLEVISY